MPYLPQHDCDRDLQCFHISYYPTNSITASPGQDSLKNKIDGQPAIMAESVFCWRKLSNCTLTLHKSDTAKKKLYILSCLRGVGSCKPAVSAGRTCGWCGGTCLSRTVGVIAVTHSHLTPEDGEGQSAGFAQLPGAPWAGGGVGGVPSAGGKTEGPRPRSEPRLLGPHRARAHHLV